MKDKITITLAGEEASRLLTDVLPSLASAAAASGRHDLVALASDLAVRLLEADTPGPDDETRAAIIVAARASAELARNMDAMGMGAPDVDHAAILADAVSSVVGKVVRPGQLRIIETSSGCACGAPGCNATDTPEEVDRSTLN
jgi:hypothetical protein